MLELLRKEADRTYTENNALSNVSTGSECLDLFALIGALRFASEEDIIEHFVVVSALMPIGPRAWSFCVLMPRMQISR